MTSKTTHFRPKTALFLKKLALPAGQEAQLRRKYPLPTRRFLRKTFGIIKNMCIFAEKTKTNTLYIMTIYENNSVKITVEPHKIPGCELLDSTVYCNGEPFICITWPEVENFKRELTELLDKYRI